MAFIDLAAELAGTLPGLSPILAETYIGRAWRDICNARLWSFLTVEGAILCPGQITAGTVTCTQNSATVTCNAAATTALTGYTGSALAPLTSLQFRAQGQSIYNIIAAVGNPLVLTLDRVFVEATGAGQSYQVYRCYVPAPATNFLTWLSFDDFQNGYAITGDRLSRSRTMFDAADPQRQSQGQAYYLGENKGSTTVNPTWELWPHPTSGQTWIVTYRSTGVVPDFTASTSAPPPIIPDALVMVRALGWYGYAWAKANAGGFDRYRTVDLAALTADAKNQYTRELLDVKRNDDELALQTVYSRGRRGRAGGRFLTDIPGPADADYWQSHGVWW